MLHTSSSSAVMASRSSSATQGRARIPMAAAPSRRAPCASRRANGAVVRVGARRRVPELNYSPFADHPAEEEEEQESVQHVVEEADASSDGLFNANFKAALASALQRQGPESLVQGAERVNDENRISDQEEVLKAAIVSSRTTLLKLQTARAELEKAIESETKQVERLIFALEKARNDAAYYRGLANMMDEGGTSD